MKGTNGTNIIKVIVRFFLCGKGINERKYKYFIERIYLTREQLFGINSLEKGNIDLMEGVIICIRDNIINESKNQLVSMLEVLFTKLEAEKKKKILSENHGIIMSLDIERRINEMCNLSEAIEERGIERGKIITLLELVDSKEISAERFVEKTGYTVEEARKICECD